MSRTTLNKEDSAGSYIGRERTATAAVSEDDPPGESQEGSQGTQEPELKTYYTQDSSYSVSKATKVYESNCRRVDPTYELRKKEALTIPAVSFADKSTLPVMIQNASFRPLKVKKAKSTLYDAIAQGSRAGKRSYVYIEEYGQNSTAQPILSHRSGPRPSKVRSQHRKTKSIEPRDVRDAQERLERFMAKERKHALLKFEQVERQMKKNNILYTKDKVQEHHQSAPILEGVERKSTEQERKKLKSRVIAVNLKKIPYSTSKASLSQSMNEVQTPASSIMLPSRPGEKPESTVEMSRDQGAEPRYQLPKILERHRSNLPTQVHSIDASYASKETDFDLQRLIGSNSGRFHRARQSHHAELTFAGTDNSQDLPQTLTGDGKSGNSKDIKIPNPKLEGQRTIARSPAQTNLNYAEVMLRTRKPTDSCLMLNRHTRSVVSSLIKHHSLDNNNSLGVALRAKRNSLDFERNGKQAVESGTSPMLTLSARKRLSGTDQTSESSKMRTVLKTKDSKMSSPVEMPPLTMDRVQENLDLLDRLDKERAAEVSARSLSKLDKEEEPALHIRPLNPIFNRFGLRVTGPSLASLASEQLMKTLSVSGLTQKTISNEESLNDMRRESSMLIQGAADTPIEDDPKVVRKITAKVTVERQSKSELKQQEVDVYTDRDNNALKQADGKKPTTAQEGPYELKEQSKDATDLSAARPSTLHATTRNSPAVVSGLVTTQGTLQVGPETMEHSKVDFTKTGQKSSMSPTKQKFLNPDSVVRKELQRDQQILERSSKKANRSSFRLGKLEQFPRFKDNSRDSSPAGSSPQDSGRPYGQHGMHLKGQKINQPASALNDSRESSLPKIDEIVTNAMVSRGHSSQSRFDKNAVYDAQASYVKHNRDMAAKYPSTLKLANRTEGVDPYGNVDRRPLLVEARKLIRRLNDSRGDLNQSVYEMIVPETNDEQSVARASAELNSKGTIDRETVSKSLRGLPESLVVKSMTRRGEIDEAALLNTPGGDTATFMPEQLTVSKDMLDSGPHGTSSQRQKNDILEAMLSIDAADGESDRGGLSFDPDDAMPQLASMFSTPRDRRRSPEVPKVAIPKINVRPQVLSQSRSPPKRVQRKQDEQMLRQLVLEIEKIIAMRDSSSPFEVSRPYRVDSILPKPRNLSEMSGTQRQIASQGRRTGMLISNLQRKHKIKKAELLLQDNLSNALSELDRVFASREFHDATGALTPRGQQDLATLQEALLNQKGYLAEYEQLMAAKPLDIKQMRQSLRKFRVARDGPQIKTSRLKEKSLPPRSTFDDVRRNDPHVRLEQLTKYLVELVQRLGNELKGKKISAPLPQRGVVTEDKRPQLHKKKLVLDEYKKQIREVTKEVRAARRRNEAQREANRYVVEVDQAAVRNLNQYLFKEFYFLEEAGKFIGDLQETDRRLQADEAAQKGRRELSELGRVAALTRYSAAEKDVDELDTAARKSHLTIHSSQTTAKPEHETMTMTYTGAFQSQTQFGPQHDRMKDTSHSRTNSLQLRDGSRAETRYAPAVDELAEARMDNDIEQAKVPESKKSIEHAEPKPDNSQNIIAEHLTTLKNDSSSALLAEELSKNYRAPARHLLGLYQNIIVDDLEQERKDLILEILLVKGQLPAMQMELEQERQKNMILQRRVAMYHRMIKEAQDK